MDIFGNFTRLRGDNKRRRVKKNSSFDFTFSDISTPNSIGEVQEADKTYFSLLLAKSLVVLVFCVLVFKLFLLQAVQGKFNERLAESNRVHPRVVEAKRGVITDKNGQWLARNKPSFSLAIYPADLPKKESERTNVYSKLSEFIGEPIEEIKKTAEANNLTSLYQVSIKENIPHDQALVLEKKIVELPGVFMAKEAIRDYAILPGVSHVIGYTGKVSFDDLEQNPEYLMSDKIGKNGIEYSYESSLKGNNGIEEVEVDSKGTIIRVLIEDKNRQPDPGNDLTLYLDSNLQKKAAESLMNGINEARKTVGEDQVHAGVAAVMDVRSGGILAMVSLPDYDLNLFAGRISNSQYKTLSNDKNLPMFNRSIKGAYPPGSIVKIVMAAAGLEEGNITSSTSIITPSAIKIGDYVFPDWKDHSYESTNVERAIAESNNIFFYALGGGFDKIKGLGIEKIKKYWEMFGLGKPTGIDLPGEAGGLLPDPEWKQKAKKEPWYLGDTYHVSIGQGDLLVTPMQMLKVTAAIANGGKLLQPQMVHKITNQKGEVQTEFGPRIERDNFISADVIKVIQEGMRLTITEGSARNLNDLPVKAAGKTGTAQFLNNQKTHAWFEGYAPYDDPEIAVIVMVEGGGGGHEIAAPVAKEILQYYFGNR